MTDINKYIGAPQAFDAVCTIKSGTLNDFEGFGIVSTEVVLGNEVRVTFENTAPDSDKDKQTIHATASGKNSGQSASVVLASATTCNVFTTNNNNDNLIFPIYVTRVLTE